MTFAGWCDRSTCWHEKGHDGPCDPGTRTRLVCAYGSHDFHDSSVEGHVECSRCGAVYAKPVGVTQHAGWAGSPAFSTVKDSDR